MRQDPELRTRVDVSTRHDGKMDNWETYRLLYGANGVARLEVNPKGTGQFVAVNPK